MTAPSYPSHHIIRIRAGNLSADIAPAIGGSIAGVRFGATPLFRPSSAHDLAAGDVRGMACYPLVPYSNRVRDAAFDFAGRRYDLARNFGDHPHAIHGNGWQSPWQVHAQDGASAVLELVHRPADEAARLAWPFAYRAEQRFAVAEGSLSVAIAIENIGDEAMPAGLGLHPFFPRQADTRLRFAARDMWINDATVLPVERVPAPAEWRAPGGRRVDDRALDTVFVGWDGEASIAWPDRGLELVMRAAPKLSRLVVYTPPGRDFFAVEPVSHDTDAFNRMAAGDLDTGASVLRPGETLAAAVTFDIRTTRV